MTAETPLEPFHHWQTILCVDCGFQFKVPIYCGNRFCTVCGVGRRARLQARLRWLIAHRPRTGGTMLKHLTLTVRNDADCSRMVKHLVRSFRKFRQRSYFKSLVIGGAYVIELTNTGNGWHAHIHALIQAYRIEISELMKIWEVCCGGRGSVYIRNIEAGQGLAYLTKYVTKSTLSDELQLEATAILRNYRLFSPFGAWYAINSKYVRPVCICPECGLSKPYECWEVFFGEWERKVRIE